MEQYAESDSKGSVLFLERLLYGRCSLMKPVSDARTNPTRVGEPHVDEPLQVFVEVGKIFFALLVVRYEPLFLPDQALPPLF